MVCPKCKKIVVESMNFCPYCGSQINKQATREVGIEKLDIAKERIEKGEYTLLLGLTVIGDMYAKYRYIEYLEKQSRSSMPNRKADYSTLKQLANNGDPFAVTAYAISLYYENRKKGIVEELTEGIKYDEAKVSEAYQLVQAMSNEMNEPVAQFYMWKWSLVDDDATAYKLMDASAKNEYPPALYTLGLWYFEGSNGVRKNQEKGYELLELSAMYGYEDAVEFFKCENEQWFETDLNKALDENLIDTAIRVLGACDHDKKSESQKERELAQEEENNYVNKIIEKCVTFDDYVAAYKKLMEKDFYIIDVPQIQNMVISKMKLLSGLSENSFDDLVRLKEQLDKCTQQMDSYKSLEQFASFREWATVNNIKAEVVKVAIDYGNVILARDYANDIQAYKIYKREKPRSLFELIWSSCLLFIITMVISAFFPVAMIIGIVIIIAGGIVPMFSEKKFRKCKKSFQKVDALDRLGYSFE